MAAHSPLSGLIAQEAGFDGLWASGFELSALYGVPDMSVITMTQHLDMVRAITGRVAIPVIADIDTGFGNVVNVAHAVEAYERAGVAGLVIEDKCFPKVSSLAADSRQDLVTISEFQGKIEAARSVRKDNDLLVIARTEALVAGSGLDEALKRAKAYEAAGADLILVHSKSETPQEIADFSRAWKGCCRLVIVPTAYPSIDEDTIRQMGRIAMIIYGNHAIRACVTAMKKVFGDIRRKGSIGASDCDVVPVKEVFRLQDMAKAVELEKRYLR